MFERKQILFPGDFKVHSACIYIVFVANKHTAQGHNKGYLKL